VDKEPSHLPNRQSADYRPLVLAVDDNEDNLALIAIVLELFGCAFLTAMNAQTALDLAANNELNLILMDMMLPDMSGIEVVSHLKANPQTAKVPVIAITALARAEDKEQMIAAGCVDYISKPYVVEELEELLAKYLH
jgi:two-component system cell cycle response regulator DivK